MATLISTNPAPVPRIKSITIRLSIEEVFALETVLSSVSGPPRTSRRALCDTVLRCLQQATRSEKDPSHTDLKGSLTFSGRYQ